MSEAKDLLEDFCWQHNIGLIIKTVEDKLMLVAIFNSGFCLRRDGRICNSEYDEYNYREFLKDVKEVYDNGGVSLYEPSLVTKVENLAAYAGDIGATSLWVILPQAELDLINESLRKVSYTSVTTDMADVGFTSYNYAGIWLHFKTEEKK